jgi:uncharacterized protein (DUF1810 family)
VSGCDRFIESQDHGGTFAQAMSELRAGRKRSHWMWFVFPQLAGLGHSEMSRRYAITSLEEAREYLADPVLGWRLREAAAALLDHEGESAEAILGGTDALKLRSSMTLFARADPEEPVFGRVLDAFFGGEADPATEELLARG